jgi:hypothetical protein
MAWNSTLGGEAVEGGSRHPQAFGQLISIEYFAVSHH